MHASSQCGGNAPKRVILTTNTETINAQNQTRKLVEATIGVNAKPVGGAIPNKPVMLLETAEKASVAAKKVRDAQAATANLKAATQPNHTPNIPMSGKVSGTSVPKQPAATGKNSVRFADVKPNAHLPKAPTKLPTELKSYIREVEAKSGLTVHPKQRELLAQDLRETSYPRFEKTDPAYKAHKAVYDNPKVKRDLKAEWKEQTGQDWPTYEGINPRTKLLETMDYQAHHINPQQLGGKHEWWNIHPVHPNAHQGGVHGTGSQLNKIMKGLNNNG